MWVYLPAKVKMMHDINQIKGAPKAKVEAMFDSISGRYDLLNRLLSMGTDVRWRKRAVREIGRRTSPRQILDVATGTGDLAVTALMLNPGKVTGIDISDRMLEVGREKMNRLKLNDRIELLTGDSESISFGDLTFDAVMCAFGVRNFENTVKGLSEMFRVLNHGGVVMILEFSRPSWFPLKQIYGFYFRRILPWIGRRISGDREAYSYLPDSVMSFPDNEAFLSLLTGVGFSKVKQIRLSGGIASIYSGEKA